MPSLFARLFNRGVHDVTFEYLLENYFWKDFERVVTLTQSHKYDLNKDEKRLLDFLREKYSIDKGCPSGLFPYVSKELQERYFVVHNLICSFLYPDE